MLMSDFVTSLPLTKMTREHPHEDQAEHLAAGPNLRLNSGEGGGGECEAYRADDPGEEGADRGEAQGRSRLPSRASWWPSIAVITDEASPGTLTRIEVVEPPYIAP